MIKYTKEILEKIINGEMRPFRNESKRRAQVISSLQGSLGLPLYDYSPELLPLSGWWKASYTASPWVKNTSIGTSGSTVDLVAGVDPSVGTAVNGFTPATFNGSNNYLVASTTTTNLLASASWSISILFFANAAGVSDTAAYDNTGIFTDNGALGGIMIMTSSGRPKVYMHQYNGSHNYAGITTMTTGDWQLVQAKYDGATTSVRVNGRTRNTSSISSGIFGSSQMIVGAKYNVANYFNGSILEIITMNSTISDTDEDKILTYMRLRYNLALNFDPAILNLTGWWKASYAGAPWVKNGSAGTSGSTANFTNSNVDPSTGTAVNGLTPATFNGSSNQLWADLAVTNFFTNSAWSMSILFFANAALTDAGSSPENTGVLVDTGATVGCYIMTQGGIPKVYINMFNGSVYTYNATTTFTLGSWQLVQAKYDGANVKLRINGGTPTTSSMSGGTLVAGSLRLRLGSNYNNGASTYFNGSILEFMTMDTTISDADEDNILVYMRNRYGLTLT